MAKNKLLHWILLKWLLLSLMTAIIFIIFPHHVNKSSTKDCVGVQNMSSEVSSTGCGWTIFTIVTLIYRFYCMTFHSYKYFQCLYHHMLHLFLPMVAGFPNIQLKISVFLPFYNCSFSWNLLHKTPTCLCSAVSMS